MKRHRLNNFIEDVKKSFETVAVSCPEKQSNIEQLWRDLETKYPEISNTENSLAERSAQRYENVMKKMNESKNSARFMEFTGIEDQLKKDTKEDRLKSINLLSTAIGDSKRKAVYYSALQGELIQGLDLQDESILREINMSRSYAYFLKTFSILVNEFHQLMHCELPIRYFKQHLKIISDICKNNPEAWK